MSRTIVQTDMYTYNLRTGKICLQPGRTQITTYRWRWLAALVVFFINLPVMPPNSDVVFVPRAKILENP